MSFSTQYLNKLTQVLEQLDKSEIDHALSLLERAWRSGKQVIIFGNGGSAMTALHFATDWSKSVYLDTGRPLLARTLIDNMGLITAYANDMEYENLFVEQLKTTMNDGDLVLAISGSGNSANIVKAIDYANANGGITLGLCGFDGGRLKDLAQHQVWANVQDMQLSEDVHAIFGHIAMQFLCELKA